MNRKSILPLGLAGLLLAAVAGAQAPADAVFSGFEPNGEFLFELDGQELSHAEVFYGERSGAFLIMAPELSSPLLLGTRTGTVESVHLMKVAKRENGTVDLLADAAFDQGGRFRLENHEVLFEVKGKPAKLKRKPDLVGSATAERLLDYKADYAYHAGQYNPSQSLVNVLKGNTKNARVLIYFGSWCPTCSRLVPKVLQLDQLLGDSSIEFDYYGLPRQMQTDPKAKADKIDGVPTGIVYVDGKEIARLGVKELNDPAAALRSLLVK
jgi:thiol-disulfide isomerase/thioredoxin